MFYSVQYSTVYTFRTDCMDCAEGFETSLSLLALNPDALKVPVVGGRLVGGGWVCKPNLVFSVS